MSFFLGYSKANGYGYENPPRGIEKTLVDGDGNPHCSTVPVYKPVMSAPINGLVVTLHQSDFVSFIYHVNEVNYVYRISYRK